MRWCGRARARRDLRGVQQTPGGRDAASDAPIQGGDTYWAAMRCGFECGSCKFLSPLDHLDADGAVDCMHCGLHQKFEVWRWKEALAGAQAVGDLAGPKPEGRRPHPFIWIGSANPHKNVGVTQTLVEVKHAGTVDGVGGMQRALQLETAPGHPICRRCHVPLAVSVMAQGHREHRLPKLPRDGELRRAGERERALRHKLLAVIAAENRVDRPKAQELSREAGAVALKCPACGAPFTIARNGDPVHVCTFCNVACLVPNRALFRARNEAPAPEIWWVLFQGPSTKRAELEAPKVEEKPSPSKVLAAMKNRGVTIGEAPGTYEAPEVVGINWPQGGAHGVARDHRVGDRLLHHRQLTESAERVHDEAARVDGLPRQDRRASRDG